MITMLPCVSGQGAVVCGRAGRVFNDIYDTMLVHQNAI